MHAGGDNFGPGLHHFLDFCANLEFPWMNIMAKVFQSIRRQSNRTGALLVDWIAGKVAI